MLAPITSVLPLVRLAPLAPVEPSSEPVEAPLLYTDDYFRRLQQLSGKRMAYTPSVKHLAKGADALTERLAMIASARSSIMLATYAVQYGPETVRLLDALIARAREGVAVCFKFDASPEFALGRSDDILGLGPKLRELQAAGGVVCVYGQAQQRESMGSGDHMKATIIDGKDAIVGGRNFGFKHFNGAWGDYDVRVAGSVVAQYAAEIEKTVRQATLYHEDPMVTSTPEEQRHFGDVLAHFHGDVRVNEKAALAREQDALFHGNSPGIALQVVTCDPAFCTRVAPKGEHKNAITQAFIETIDRAREEIILNCNCFNPGPETIDAIVRARKRGVTVHIITTRRDGAGHSDMPYRNALRVYPALLAAGVNIWESQNYQHEKLFVADGKLASVGSYNFEPAAEGKLKEQATFSTDPRWVDDIRAFLCETIRTGCEAHVPEDKSLTWWEILLYPFWKPIDLLKDQLAWALRDQF